MNTNMKIMMHANSCNCAACAPVPTLGIEMPYEEEKKTTKTKKGPSKLVVGENDLATVAPKVAAMWSDKNAFSPSKVAAGSRRKFTFVCPDCGQEFESKIFSVVRSVMNGNTGCPVCAGIKIVSGINDLATKYPKAAAMWSNKNACSPSEVAANSNKKARFACPDCSQEFEAKISDVVRSVKNGTKGCPVCEGLKVVPGINDLTTKCPKAAAMWSSKNKLSASEVTARSNKKAIFKCPDCKQEFKTIIRSAVKAVKKGRTGCPICAGKIVVPGINDLATKYPKVAAMWSNKNACFPSEVSTGTIKKAWFKCPDCKREFEATISSVVRSVRNDCTGCYDCNMRRINAISKPECFVVRLMLAFAGENGISNPFFDVRNILGENSLFGLDFVDHIQKLCGEYNGVAWHGDDEHVVRDRFKFEAAHKAGYTMIRIQEPGLEVLDPKYDIVMPEGFMHGNVYVPEIMEEVGRKVIHLLEEIYGRKASPEIWALNNFKEFEVWYDANKKELEANARKKGPKGKTAAKMAA